MCYFENAIVRKENQVPRLVSIISLFQVEFSTPVHDPTLLENRLKVKIVLILYFILLYILKLKNKMKNYLIHLYQYQCMVWRQYDGIRS